MRTPILLMSAALALAGCDQRQTAQLQQAASAAIGNVHQGVDAASAPLGQLKEQASAALGAAKQVGAAATLLNPELKEQVEKLKRQASDIQGAIQPKP
ncbi:hypothetical protein KIF53_00100 [Chromobacterium subtsugae]|uniref:Lipoprotein n=1 Tax=Chromobacterium subtsugae TaxID=251747 RepID=A0ABS7F9R4_9NEIS|nr:MULTISPECIES: hypothetical protein [Chromobacterium]KUM03097.1 hypothetical protein Cv017_21475 [Chromobacterium subtsugae]KZE86154.1 hypothetical protein AWB61_16590 [Chromobacterium sp. F49]MBW7568832.1 hypothetical protein [Chromobacterium subtsugae]MBW8286033.1 hypothetical protein [Chromobacterium subtsugae]OBU86306.1 hypothetical protein MY55_11620 [Chromobacterium subtsugae]